MRSEHIWLEGAVCSPLRVPLAIALSLLRKVAIVCRMVGQVKVTSPDLAVLSILASTFALCYFTMAALDYQYEIFTSDLKPHWTLSLLANLVGYSAVILPGLAVLKYVNATNYMDNRNCLGPMIKLCFFGSEPDLQDSINDSKKVEKNDSDLKRFIHIIGCFLGLQVSYLTWGLLQEKIMTQKYQNSAGETGLFSNSQFLVFVNRVLAFGVALGYITLASRIPRHAAPIYKYSYCSISNIMSSWCQYEALKFVSFPTQVLAKASKIIPVMAMGRIVSGKTYQAYEYLVAVMISLGMVLFLYGSQETVQSKVSSGGQVTTVSGFILLVGYMVSDAFTSNWQNELFTTYKMSPVQAMCGVNLFSCLFTSVSLTQVTIYLILLTIVCLFPKEKIMLK